MKTKKIGKIHTYSLLVVFLFIAIISCDKNPYNDNSRLLGTWISTYNETYIYDGKTFTSAYDGKNSYVITVERIIYSSDTAGIIYGKYTENSTYGDAVVGKYYAVSFKDLTYNNISISGAYKSDGKNGTDTLVEAITEFTINNGYYGTYSSCKKVK